MEKKIDSILSILKEHSQLLRVLKHRTEVTGAEVTAIKEDINHMKGDITGLKEEQAVIKNDLGVVKDELGVVKNDQTTLSARIDKNHTEVIMRLDDLDEKMDYVMLYVARHEAKLLAKKKLS